MHLQIGNQSYVNPSTGKLVEGRLSVLLRDSDNLADTFTLEGSSFVQAANPVLLHGGLPDDSLFVQAGVYRLKVELYHGPDGAMSVDSPDEDFEQIDIFEAGLDWDSAVTTANQVDTIADLAQVDPDLKAVTVLGYDAVGDCTPRLYVWDKDSVDQIDGGYVIGSSVSDTGRWILLYGDEVLPCTMYGVRPGSESNMNALMGYPSTVGSFRLATAPCIRFTLGDYTSDVIYVTDKCILMDGGARFTHATIRCQRVRVAGEHTSYVGDFVIDALDAEAHSSWYRTLAAFWDCGAKYLYLDTTNYFNDTLINANINLSGKVVTGTSRIACTYGSGRHFIVDASTTINGRIFTPASDYVRVATSSIGDGIFTLGGVWDPGLIADGHHIQYDQVPDLDLFSNADRWVKAMVERRDRLSEQVWQSFVLDLQNRRVTSVNVGKFRDIRNLTTDGLTINNSGEDIVLRNVSATAVNATCRYLTAYDCDLGFSNEPSIEGIWCHDSRISSATAWRDGNVQCTFDRCRIGISFDRVTDNETLDSVLSFVSSQFADNIYIRAKNVDMKYCTARNLTLKIFPYKVGSSFFIRASLIGNYFNNATPIEFTRLDVVNGQAQENVYDCILQWNIVNNTFQGNDEGLRMRYWQDRTGVYYTRTFVKFAPNVHAIAYEGNTGNCPLRDMKGVLQYQTSSTYVEEELSGVTLYKYPQSNRKLVPNIVNSQVYFEKSLDGSEMMLTYPSTGDEVFTRTSWYIYPRAKDDSLNNGNFFDWAVVGINDWISADGSNATFRIV